MRQYELKERKEISKIICNKCGKEIPVSGGHEMKGVFRVDYEWGYFSEKDGERHAASLSLADVADDTVQRQQPADRLRGRNADCD